jgi:hypothetical protein
MATGPRTAASCVSSDMLERNVRLLRHVGGKGNSLCCTIIIGHSPCDGKKPQKE